MMRKILILALLMTSFKALAQTAAEEAIILNQELQFLEDSINTTQALSINSLSGEPSSLGESDESSLERQYFNEMTEEDSVSTRTAGPKRRGL